MGILSAKVAIITGASSGIGYATAKLYAKEGAKVVLGARRENELNDLVDEIRESGGQATAFAGDVKDESYAKELVDIAVGEYGGLDIAFNNAGIMGTGGPIAEITMEDLNDTIGTNLIGAALGAKYQIAEMQKKGKGSIIFTSTFVGYTVSLPGTSVYAISKAGLFALAQTIAVETGPMGIRSNAIITGGVKTPMGDAATSTPESLEFVNSIHALKRRAEPEEIAEVALFLGSDRSSFITGTAVPADGGVSVNKT